MIYKYLKNGLEIKQIGIYLIICHIPTYFARFARVPSLSIRLVLQNRDFAIHRGDEQLAVADG